MPTKHGCDGATDTFTRESLRFDRSQHRPCPRRRPTERRPLRRIRCYSKYSLNKAFRLSIFCARTIRAEPPQNERKVLLFFFGGFGFPYPANAVSGRVERG